MHSVFVCRAHLFCLCKCHYLRSLTLSGNLPHGLWQGLLIEFKSTLVIEKIGRGNRTDETGMRPDEVCRIRRENVHLDQGYLFNPFGKTKAARRKVPLTEKARALLARRPEKVKGDFVSPVERPTNQSSE